MPTLPLKIWLRRKEVESAVGGRRQLESLERSGTLTGTVLPGYQHKRFARAKVQDVLTALGGK